MQKGKFGIYLPFYAIVAFVLAFLGELLLCGVVLGFVIVVEKNEWLTKQVMQAFFLCLLISFLLKIFDMSNVFSDVPFIGIAFLIFGKTIFSIILIIILVFIIISIVRVCKGNDAKIPLLYKLANRSFGIVEKKIYTQVNKNGSSFN